MEYSVILNWFHPPPSISFFIPACSSTPLLFWGLDPHLIGSALILSVLTQSPIFLPFWYFLVEISYYRIPSSVSGLFNQLVNVAKIPKWLPNIQRIVSTSASLHSPRSPAGQRAERARGIDRVRSSLSSFPFHFLLPSCSLPTLRFRNSRKHLHFAVVLPRCETFSALLNLEKYLFRNFSINPEKGRHCQKHSWILLFYFFQFCYFLLQSSHLSNKINLRRICGGIETYPISRSKFLRCDSFLRFFAEI